MRAIRLLESVPEPNGRGRLMNACEVAELVCEGKVSARWVIQRMGPRIGSKPGRQWYFWQTEAEREWARYLQSGRAA